MKLTDVDIDNKILGIMEAELSAETGIVCNKYACAAKLRKLFKKMHNDIMTELEQTMREMAAADGVDWDALDIGDE